jgi:hypothetical protein
MAGKRAGKPKSRGSQRVKSESRGRRARELENQEVGEYESSRAKK